MSNHGNFYRAISSLLVKNLDQYKDKPLNRPTCIQIYTTVFETLTQLFETSEVKVGNEAANWMAQAFYDSININGGHETDPNIFTQRASLDNIETKELALMAMMLKDTPLAGPIVATIKRRS